MPRVLPLLPRTLHLVPAEASDGVLLADGYVPPLKVVRVGGRVLSSLCPRVENRVRDKVSQVRRCANDIFQNGAAVEVRVLGRRRS